MGRPCSKVRRMNLLWRWILGLVATTATATISYVWLDRPVALFVHEWMHPEPRHARFVHPDARPLRADARGRFFWSRQAHRYVTFL